MQHRETNDAPVILFNSSVPPDVEIAVFDDIYHLHSTTLRNCSKFFDKSLSGTWWREENTHHGADGIKYRYKLVLDKETPLMSIVEPVPAKGTSHNTEKMDVSEIQVSIPDVSMAEAENSAAAHTYKILQEAYSNLFRIFYNNKTADIPCDNFKRIKAIVELADLYCSLPIIAGAIELLVIKFSRHPRGTICVHSDDIIIIANKIHSKTLYHESFVHLVGQVGSESWRVKKDSLPKEIRLQVLEEYARISDIKKMVDRDIIKYICSIVRSTSGRNNIAAQKASEVEDICGDNWYCEGYNDIESCKEQRGEFGMYQAIRDLGVEPTTYHFTVDMLLDITLKLDEVCPRGDLICANLSEYPWEEADDW